MVMVTDTAKQHLKEILQGHNNGRNLGIRLTLKETDANESSFNLEFSKEGFEDRVVKHDGYKVLLVGPEIVQLVAGATLDSQDTPDGVKLKLTRGKQK
jgi:Fe-S cluster assembly iron-binding protein IscA